MFTFSQTQNLRIRDVLGRPVGRCAGIPVGGVTDTFPAILDRAVEDSDPLPHAVPAVQVSNLLSGITFDSAPVQDRCGVTGPALPGGERGGRR